MKIIVQLKLESSDGKRYKTDCADTEGMLRIMQLVPSPRAESFKLWLAKVSDERIGEINNPELSMDRTKEHGIIIRRNLTAETIYINLFV